MTIYVLHGYTDGLIDPIANTDYEKVYEAMRSRLRRDYGQRGNQMILTGNTVFWKAGLLLLLCMAIGWNGRLRNWS